MFCLAVNFQVKHLIEIAIIQIPVPPNGNCIPAHNVWGGLGIIGSNVKLFFFLKSALIIFIISTSKKVVKKTADGEICYREKIIENNSEILIQSFFKFFFQHGL